jgi:type IV pilus assembly protein PilQ
MRILFLLGLTMRNKILFMLCVFSSVTWGSTLNDIKFAELPGERFEVRMSFSDAPPEPKGYTIEKPARVVLDFPDVVSSLKERRFPLSFENGQSAMVLTTDGRTRLVVNLDQLTSYTSRREGSDYILEIGATHGESLTGKVAATAGLEIASNKTMDTDVVKMADGKSSITNIDFRRGPLGEGRIIITLSDSHVTADLVSTGSGVKISFANVAMPSELRRRLDVMDFATPVTLINSTQDGKNSTLNISAAGDFDYMAYQAENEYVVSVKSLTAAEKREKNKDFEFKGDKLSFNFQDIEVRAVLQIIADFTELNLVASDTVQGRITLRLDNVPWDQALALVLKTKGLDKRQEGNVLMIAPAAEISERERQELATKKQLEELAPMRTEYIRIRYANAKDMFELFKGDSKTKNSGGGGGEGGNKSTGSVLSDRGQAIVDERTNSIIVTDTAERIEALKKLIEQIDIPIRQVMIEARIVIANTDFRRELGIRWGAAAYGLSNGKISQLAGSEAGLDSDPGNPYEFLTGQQGKSLNITEQRIVDLGVESPAGSLAAGLLIDNAFLDMELSALENSGYAEVVSQPKVITSDKQLATIKTGKEIAYQEASASGATTTAFKEAVLRLEVTPQITPDNHVIMDLLVYKDQIADVTISGVPTIDITRLETKVLVNNGETVVLGGVFGLDTLKTDIKVPVLGDIPYLGRLFKRTIDKQTKTELLIFVTPRIIADKLVN